VLRRKFVPIAMMFLLATVLMSASLFARPASNSMSVNDTEKRLDASTFIVTDTIETHTKCLPQD